MKFKLNRLALGAFERLSKKLKATLLETSLPLNDYSYLDGKRTEDENVYLWDWEYGFTKIECPNCKLYLAIISALQIYGSELNDSRKTTPSFSYVGIHNKARNTMNMIRFSDVELMGLQQEEDERSFIENNTDYYRRY